DCKDVAVEFFHRATNFPFMSTRKVWYGLSIVLILISIVSLITRALNLGVDFTGGVTVQASFPAAANRDAVSSALVRAGYADPQVTIFGTSRDIAIRLPPSKQSTEAVRARLEQILRGIARNATADLRLYRRALSHLAPVVRGHPCGIARSDPGARHVFADAHELRSDCGRGDAGGDWLFAERWGGGIRPYPGIFPRQPPARAGPGARSVDQSDPVAHHHDQGRDADRRGGVVRAGRPRAARLFRGADHRHPGRHLLIHLYFQCRGAGLRPEGRAPVAVLSQTAGRQHALKAPQRALSRCCHC